MLASTLYLKIHKTDLHAPGQHSSTDVARNSTSFLLSYGPNRPELFKTQLITDLRSLQQREYELQVDELEEKKAATG